MADNLHMFMRINKVAAFITRDTSFGRELLVFRHPTAGVQIPAGTVDPGESLEAAVLREVKEEANLSEVRIVSKLLSFNQHLRPDQFMLLQKEVLQSHNLEPLGFSVTRGMTVRLLEKTGVNARVAYDEYDYKEGELVIKETYIGWIPQNSLTNDVKRHLFHLRTMGQIDDIWEVHADRGHLFRFYWVPIHEDPGLVEGQGTWFDQTREKLLEP